MLFFLLLRRHKVGGSVDVIMGCLFLSLCVDLPQGLAEMCPWSCVGLVLLQIKSNKRDCTYYQRSYSSVLFLLWHQNKVHSLLKSHLTFENVAYTVQSSHSVA